MEIQEQSKLGVAILVISDTASAEPSTDTAGPALQSVFADVGSNQWNVVVTKIVPDEVLQIQQFIKNWSDSEDKVNLVITTGGTGFAAKDRTPEVRLNRRLAAGELPLWLTLTSKGSLSADTETCPGTHVFMLPRFSATPC